MEEAFVQARWWQNRAQFFKDQVGHEAMQEFYFSMEQASHYIQLILITSDPEIVHAAYSLVLLKLS